MSLAILTKLFKHEYKTVPLPLRAQKGLKKRLNLKKRIEEVDFVSFDTELTGLDFQEDSIISIGAIRMKGGRIFPAQTFYSLVRPESELKTDSIVVHGITPDDLNAAPDIKDVLVEFFEFIDDAVLIGHFVFIDVKFLDKALKKHFGIKLQNPVIDTFNIHEWLYDNDSAFSRHYRGMTTKKDLFSMARRYGLLIEQSHNALYDAYLTAQLFQVFLRFLPGCGINTLEELLMIGRA